MDLAYNHGYIKNSMNVKIDNPADDNHSDNELISLTYHTLFYAWSRVSEESEPTFRGEMWDMVNPLIPSAERTWQIIGSEFSPLWTSIFAGLIPISDDLVPKSYIDRSVWMLRNWATDLISWEYNLSNRMDIDKTPYFVRDNPSRPIIRQITTPGERQTSHWNTDPFAESEGSGYEEFEPAVWRMPYFMMMYYGLL